MATDGLLQEHSLRLPLTPSLRGRGLHPAQGSPDKEVEVSQFYCKVLKSHRRQSPRELPPAPDTAQGRAGQPGSLKVSFSHCRTSASPVPSRALASSTVTGCVAQETMSCMRNSDFISTSDM